MNTKALFFAIALLASIQGIAHPTGNLITVGNHILWSYINPIDDPAHHACVMIWDQKSEPKVLLKSDFSASDYILYNREYDIYILERRYVQASDSFEMRILKMKIGESPKEIWPWFTDDWRIGEGGFFMPSDHEIVFCRYPKIYSLEKGKSPAQYFDFDWEINRMRLVKDKQLLLLGENSCWLAQQNGTIIKTWDQLIDTKIKNAPLRRNQVFDIDYQNGELLLAYWGRRSFEVISPKGERKIISQLNDPLTPHWVAYHPKGKLLFSSKLVFDGSTPKPHLILFQSNEEPLEVWKKE